MRGLLPGGGELREALLGGELRSSQEEGSQRGLLPGGGELREAASLEESCICPKKKNRTRHWAGYGCRCD